MMKPLFTSHLLRYAMSFLLLSPLTSQFSPLAAQNPYLPLWEHVPDGEPRVFDDPDNPGRKRAYIIGSHDTRQSSYCGSDVRMWSAPVEDLTQWRDEGPLFTWFVNGQWDVMYAPDLVETTDKATGQKTYWLYPHSRGYRRVGMVCRSDRPTGPFTPVNLTADGTRCLDGSLIDFDPSVFVETVTDKRDPDFSRGYRAYVYYGFQHSTAYELDPDNMYAVRPGTKVIDPFLPAQRAVDNGPQDGNTHYDALFPGESPADFGFFEASSIRQVGNKYVMVFSGFSGPEYGLGRSNSTLRYAYGDTPLGPWRSGGVLVDSRGVVPNADGTHLISTNDGHNTHGSIQQINGQWYVFYHRPPRGYGFARQAMVAPIKITFDKKSVAKGGKVVITGYDPYAADNEWTAKATDGMVYRGAEVTSEGFNIFGLPPYAYYSAGIACYMSSHDWLQDNYDVWNNSMDLTGMENGAVIGFKYFGFGGLESTDGSPVKGIKPFAGTSAGDNTKIDLFLTPSGSACKIHIMLDGPYAGNVWNGKEIAVIDIPAGVTKSSHYQASVPAVEGLQGKHAIYLVVEGKAESRNTAEKKNDKAAKGLFTLHGIGFSKNGLSCDKPAVPTVAITVDGKQLRLPATPLFSTNNNGHIDATRYQVYAPLTSSSRIVATPSDNSVTCTVSPVVEGRATVKCTYKGYTKTYLIN